MLRLTIAVTASAFMLSSCALLGLDGDAAPESEVSPSALPTIVAEAPALPVLPAGGVTLGATEEIVDRPEHPPEEQFAISATGAPTLQLIMTPEPSGGYWLHVETTDFTWAPGNVDQPARGGEGHAHLYVDGVKITRLYSRDFFLSSELAKPGSFVLVSLSTNDHRAFAINGLPIEAEVRLPTAN